MSPEYRDNINLKEIVEKGNLGLAIPEANLIPDLVRQGLFAIVMCWMGSDRSPKFAADLSKAHPSVYIEGGFELLKIFDNSTQRRFFDYVTYAPNFFILLDEQEQDMFSYIYMDPQKLVRKQGVIAVSNDQRMLKNIYLPSNSPLRAK
jgi:hypothetical protein